MTTLQKHQSLSLISLKKTQNNNNKTKNPAIIKKLPFSSTAQFSQETTFHGIQMSLELNAVANVGNISYVECFITQNFQERLHASKREEKLNV